MLAAVAASAALAGCGATPASERVLARVGRDPITLAELDHQLSLMAPGPSPETVVPRDSGLQRRALQSLIASRWVIGEAIDRGLVPSKEAVERRLAARDAAAFPGGETERSAFLKASGESMSDLRSIAETELAQSALRSVALAGLPRAARTEIEDYYRTHRERYALPARREIWITNRKSAAAIEQLKRKVASMRSFARFSEPETVPHTPSALAARGAVGRAIFAAKRNVLIGPLKYRIDYYAFEVKRTLPATQIPLARVEASIVRELDVEARRHALGAFLARWRAKWRAMTDCYPGYTVPGCRQYSGPEKDLSLFQLQ